MLAVRAGATSVPPEQMWIRISSTGRIQNSKYPTKVLRADRPQLTTPPPPAGSKDAWGYGYIVSPLCISSSTQLILVIRSEQASFSRTTLHFGSQRFSTDQNYENGV